MSRGRHGRLPLQAGPGRRPLRRGGGRRARASVERIPPSLNTRAPRGATLGGFLGRKRDGEPGAKTLWWTLTLENIFNQAMEGST
ncbi:IS4 family transposase [Microbulbifer rhizosphaerae]|uniref:IS4 family transposase n=1 Tax=Microbulbifer rhizosphaerae TaxID=1562603 RepID=UPI001C8460E0